MASSLRNRISLHTWTLDTTPLPEALRAAREGGFDAVELRYLDFQRCYDKGLSNGEVLQIVRDSGIKVAVMGTEYGVIFAKGEERERLFKSLDLVCSNAVQLGCPVVMVAPGMNPAGTVKDAAESFRRGGEIAAKHGIKYALEFNSRHPVINRLAVGREILALADHPSCGLLLDAYHMQCGGDGGASFADLPARDIFTVQFSDVPPGPISQVRSPTDRLPPGKGVVRWTEFFQLLIEKDYQGYMSYEAPNPAQWDRPPVEVAREGAELTRRLIAEAEKSAKR